MAILDIIRNKVLNFALEIEGEDPNAGEGAINSMPIPEEKVNQIFNTYITGQVQNVSTGGSNYTQNATIQNSKEIFDAIINALTKANADKATTDSIVGTVEEMKSATEPSEFKTHYTKFMSILADHMQVYGPIVAPFLPALAAIMP